MKKVFCNSGPGFFAYRTERKSNVSIAGFVMVFILFVDR